MESLTAEEKLHSKMMHSLIIEDEEGTKKYRGYIIDSSDESCFCSTEEVDAFLASLSKFDIEKEFQLC